MLLWTQVGIKSRREALILRDLHLNFWLHLVSCVDLLLCALWQHSFIFIIPSIPQTFTVNDIFVVIN